jgi:hypothetical protein
VGVVVAVAVEAIAEGALTTVMFCAETTTNDVATKPKTVNFISL